MYLDERSDRLLQELLRSPNITNAKLQEKFGLTRRQVEYSIQKINNWLEEQTYPTIGRSASGLFSISPELFQLISDKEYQQADFYIPSENERASMIILMLMTMTEELSLNHFISELEVSKNTVLSDLKLAQSIIDGDNLQIRYTRLHGYLIEGDEWNKRSAMITAAERIMESYGGETYLKRLMHVELAEIQKLRGQLEEVEKHLNLHFIDSKMKILPYILQAIFRRIEQKQTIVTPFMIDYDELSDTKEYEAVEILIEDRPAISKEERIYIALQLLTTNILPKQHLKMEEMPQLKQAIEQVISNFEKKAVVQLINKESLIERLFAHIKPAYYRIKYALTTDYRFLDKIDQEYQTIHYIVKQSLTPLEAFIGAKVPENEAVFITLFIGGHLIDSASNITKKLRAVVVCPNGLSISKLMEKNMRGLFPEIYFYPAMSIREFEQTDVVYDIVFTATPLATDKKLFLVNAMMDEAEKMELRRRVLRAVYMINEQSFSAEALMKTIGKYADIKNVEKLERAVQEFLFPHKEEPAFSADEKLPLAKLLPQDRIILMDKVASWREAITIAAAPLLADGSITESYVEEMHRQYPNPNWNIILRKKIAIPHAEIDKGARKLGMSMLCLREGLPLEDGSELHCMVVIAAIDKNAHFTGLLELMELAGNEEKMNVIKEARDKETIFNLIKG